MTPFEVLQKPIAGPWISGLSAARCNECGGIFDTSKDNQCPKADGGELGWHPVNSTKGAEEIKRLRDELDSVRGVLLTIGHGTHNASSKARLARQALIGLAVRAWKQPVEPFPAIIKAVKP